VGRSIKAGLRGTSAHVLPGEDLCHQRLRNTSLPIQPDQALFDPLSDGLKVGSGQWLGTEGTMVKGLGIVARGLSAADPSDRAVVSPECGDFHDDIALAAVGVLDEVEWGRLRCHLDVCSDCGALRAKYAEAARALEVLIPLGRHPSGLSHRIMDSIGRPDDQCPTVAPHKGSRAYESDRKLHRG
jgi:hypothetical protein